MNRSIDAYAAGLLDGEGCISLNRRRDRGSYGTRVDFGMTQKASTVLARMHKEYGGRLTEGRAATDRWDSVLIWNLNGTEASDFLRRVQPYVLLKQEQVRLALCVQEIRDSLPQTSPGRARWSIEAGQQCEVIYQELKRLNRKGPTPEEDQPPSGGRLIARLVAGQWMSLQSDLFTETGLAPFSGTLPQSGLVRNGQLYELPTPALPTSGRASSSSLPTPKAGDGERGRDLPRLRQDDSGRELATAVGLLPTPTVVDMGANKTPDEWAEWLSAMRERHGNGNGHGASLTQEALSMLPTPTARDYKDTQIRREHADRTTWTRSPGR